MRVAFLLDVSNKWIEVYIKEYIKNKKDFFIEFNHEKVKGFDIVFILGYTKILSKVFLESNTLNLVVHESDLPKGKGFSPIQWQILEGKDKILFTLFEIEEGLDSGDIFLQKEVYFEGHELFDEIRKIQALKTIELIGQFLEKYPNVSRTKQKGTESFYSRRNNQDDKLDINKTILEQFNHLRIANNQDYPLWFEINGYKYNIKISKDDYVK